MINETRLNTTPIQHIRNLFESIKDGKLTITYCDPVEPSFDKTFDVSCTVSDVEEFILKYETLTKSLEAIGKAHKLVDKGANPEDVLTPEQMLVWNTYVRAFDENFDSGEFDLEELCLKRKSGDELSDAENELIENYYKWFEAQVLKRLPKKEYSPILLFNIVQKYEFLISFNVPKVLIDEEARCLAEEMILYYYAKA